MTKREFFNYVIENVANEDIVAHARYEITLLDNKNASRSSKPNARQIENEGIKVNILEILKGAKPMTVGNITKAYNDRYGTEFSSNKINALITQLKDNNKVVRTVEKKIAYFSLG